jgi:alkylated DNA nucleotide flippase Atl1
MNAALAELPTGAWTTYGDLAALIGSHAVPVGARLSSHAAPNAHRVLQSEGTVSPGFRWLEPGRTEDPRALLEAEGIPFDAHGRADPSKRMTAEELAVLCGLNPGELPEPLPEPAPGQDAALRDQFVQQLHALQSHATAAGVLRVLDAWTALGGRLHYGRSGETSCFLMAGVHGQPGGELWPATIYPSGKFEVVFQYLRTRPPFDDAELREELRTRLNTLPGVDLPVSKIELRPGFELALLADAVIREDLIAVLAWFRDQAVGGAPQSDR